MNRQWLAMEHYRLHVIEQWPDGPRKAAALAAVRSTIRSLGESSGELDPGFVCGICSGRSAAGQVVEFPPRRAQLEERAA